MDTSIVIPAFNEAEVIGACLARLIDVMDSTNYTFELIVIDDGSTDGTAEIVHEFSSRDDRIVLVSLSRNFGKEAALAAGLEYGQGECMIFIDADLQHPPMLIVDMLSKWTEGFDVVNARKRNRGSESLLYRTFAFLFNAAMSSALGPNLAGASDYKLIDRQVIDALRQCPERNRFFRGLVAWVGFRPTEIYFDVDTRAAGKTKWGLVSLIKYSISTYVAFSSFPLQLVAYAGFMTTVIGFLLLAQTLFNYVTGRALSGFTTVIAVQIVLGGMVLVALGTVAIYISKMFQEQKARPIYVVRTQRGQPDGGSRKTHRQGEKRTGITLRSRIGQGRQ